MRMPEHPTLILRMLQHRLKNLATASPVLAASFGTYTHRCDRRFLAWWELHLYLFRLGSRRQLDFELRDGGPQVLANLNRLADTTQTTLPVHDTLDHFLGHVHQAGWEKLRSRCVQRLLRMK